MEDIWDDPLVSENPFEQPNTVLPNINFADRREALMSNLDTALERAETDPTQLSRIGNVVADEIKSDRMPLNKELI